jgi:ABC-type transport system involved in multi-copper enzyme maturation permease subunit
LPEIGESPAVLPIVQRELRVGARNPRLYARRLRWGVIQAIVACIVLLSSGGGFRRSSAEWFFRTLSHLALFLSLLEGVRKTSDAISAEKREGTLGFLFLSNLTGADVVFGKFSSALVRSLSVLLPFLPILAISLLVGGTTLGEFWRVALGLITILVTSLAVCLFVSTLSRHNAILAAIASIAALCFVPWLARLTTGPAKLLTLISPVDALQSAADLYFTRSPGNFWISLGFLSIITAVSLAGASFFTPRVWQESTRTTKRARRLVKRRADDRALLDRNPILWLSYDNRTRALLSTFAIILLLVGLLPLVAAILRFGDSALWLIFPGTTGAILALLIWFWTALRATNAFAESKQNGSLELLLTTPITVEGILKGHWLALWKTLQVPIYSLSILLLASVLCSSTNSIVQAIFSSKFFIEAVFEIAVLAAVGMWMGLTAKSRAAAVVYTILLAGLVPWMVCVFTLAVQIALFLRALNRTKFILNRMRRGGHTLGLQDLLRGTNSGHANMPPVIRRAGASASR